MNNQALVCQGCANAGLTSMLDLGYQPLCNNFLPVDELVGPQIFYPLGLFYCRECSLVQLGYVIPTQDTFGDQYTYLTGSSRSLVRYFTELAEELVTSLNLQPGDAVLEIGSNDGTFLDAFSSHGLNIIGVEGATQASVIALAKGVPTIESFFGTGISDTIHQRLPENSNIRLISAMNVLAHTDNVNEFLAEIVGLMGPETVFISQSHWLVSLIEKCEFDTIYHEHLRYYTVESLSKLFGRHGLYINDVEVNDFYGGSIRVTASLSESAVESPGHKEVRQREAQIDVVESIVDMKQQLLDNKAQLVSLLTQIKSEGKRTVGVGAPMKASTLLNFYGISRDLVECIGEVNQLKIGTVVPGTGIPVVNESTMFEDSPEYALLLTWNMADDIIPKLRSLGYRGKFILPVPKLEVID